MSLLAIEVPEADVPPASICRRLYRELAWVRVADQRARKGWIDDNGGGAEGNRTPDLCSAIAALSHLSYGPAP